MKYIVCDGNWLCQKYYRGKAGFSLSSVKADVDREIRNLGIDKAVMLFDLGRSSFRTSIYPDYKGNRGSKGYSLTGELELSRNYFKGLGSPDFITIYEQNTEADDLAAFIVNRYKREGDRIYLYSIDHDWLQLLDGDKVFQIRYSPTLHRNRILNEHDAEEICLTPPKKWSLLAAFGGDPSDNIPSTGIKKNVALAWLKKYNWSLAKICMNEPKAKAKQNLIFKNWQLTRLTGECAKLSDDELTALDLFFDRSM